MSPTAEGPVAGSPPRVGASDADLASEEPAPRADWFELAVAAKNQRRSTRRMPVIVAAAVRLLWQAGRSTLIAVLVLQSLAALLLAAQVFLGRDALAAIVDDATVSDGVRAAAPPLVLFTVVAGAAAVVATVLGLRQRILGDLASRAVHRRILDVTTSVDLATFEDEDFHDQLERVRVGAVARPVLMAQGLTALVGGLTAGTGLAVALLAVAPVVVPVVLLAGLPLWWSSRRAGRLEFAFHADQITDMRRRQYLDQTLSGREQAKEVRAFGMADSLLSSYERNYDSYLHALRRHVAARQRLALWGTGGASLLTAGVLLVLLWSVDAGVLTVAAAGAALLGVRLLAGRVAGVLTGLGQLYESALFFDDLQAFLSHRTSSASPAATATRAVAPADSFQSLCAQHVSFRYPGCENDVLQDVNVELPRGKVVALVGENGSGKTTLAKVLAGLYEVDSGRVARNGTDLRELPPSVVREMSAIVFQDFVRYKLSAHENIALGRPERMDDRAAVHRAAELAGVHELLSRLPDGYDTVLSKEYAGGVDLSLGQWQRVALARAFFRDAPLVILDEPSASLDARAEHELFETVRTLHAGRTVLLISHRFSTVRDADHIYVLDRGRVVEQGDHDALIERRGLYAELFTLQAAAYLPQPRTFDHSSG